MVLEKGQWRDAEIGSWCDVKSNLGAVGGGGGGGLGRGNKLIRPSSAAHIGTGS